MRVAVVGAGNVGLSAAWLLSSASPDGAEVTVFATAFSPDTTSDVAGALWFPFATGKTNPVLERRWAKATLDHFVSLMDAGDGPEAGVGGVAVREFFPDHGPPPLGWPYDALEPPAAVSRDEVLAAQQPPPLPPALCGVHYRSVMVNPPRYLSWMAARLKRAGVRLVRRSVVSTAELHAEGYHVVVNCAGLHGARVAADGDTGVTPKHGTVLQVEVVNGPPVVDVADDTANMFYVLPRPYSTTIVFGGSFVDSAATVPDPTRAKAILQGCCAMLGRPPADFRVVRTLAGVRPVRHDGIRVAARRHANGTVTAHCYGHGGCGWTAGHGSAQEVVRLVAALLGASPTTGRAVLVATPGVALHAHAESGVNEEDSTPVIRHELSSITSRL